MDDWKAAFWAVCLQGPKWGSSCVAVLPPCLMCWLCLSRIVVEIWEPDPAEV